MNKLLYIKTAQDEKDDPPAFGIFVFPSFFFGW
jgi:hypothetical protein